MGKGSTGMRTSSRRTNAASGVPVAAAKSGLHSEGSGTNHVEGRTAEMGLSTPSGKRKRKVINTSTQRERQDVSTLRWSAEEKGKGRAEPVFEVIVLGCGGGPLETNVSG